MTARNRRSVNPFAARQILTPDKWIPVHVPPESQTPQWRSAQAEAEQALRFVSIGEYGAAQASYREAWACMTSAHCSDLDLARLAFDEGMFWHRRRAEDSPGHLEKALGWYDKARTRFEHAPVTATIDPLDFADLAFNTAACQEDIATELRRSVNGKSDARADAIREQAHAVEVVALEIYERALAFYEAAEAAPIDKAWVLTSRGNLLLKRYRIAKDTENPDDAFADLHGALHALGIDRSVIDGASSSDRTAVLLAMLDDARLPVAGQAILHLANHCNSIKGANAALIERAFSLQHTAVGIFTYLAGKEFGALDRIRTAEHALALWNWRSRRDAKESLLHVDRALALAELIAKHPDASWEDVLSGSEQFKATAQHAVGVCMAMGVTDPSYNVRAFQYVQRAKGMFARMLANRHPRNPEPVRSHP